MNTTKTADKAAAPKAKKAAAAKKTAAKKGGKRKHPLTAKITMLVKDNPKREGTACHKRFALYAKHNTVESFLQAGGKTGDLNWDSKHGFIKIEE